MQKESKVVHVGLGPVGSRMVRHIVTKRKGIRYVGAIDVLPEIMGKTRLFKNVVAQFIGRLYLITQGNYKNLGWKVSNEAKYE